MLKAALRFPASAEDLDAAFNNSIAAGVMQRDNPNQTDYWARHEFLAFDAEGGFDVFINTTTQAYLTVPRAVTTEE